VRSTRTLHITIRGRLSDRVVAGFDGMTLVQHRGSTELVGQLVDQAQLHGMLTRIRDLGLELESVLVLDADPTTGRHANASRSVR
jgi:hypothetical protein